MTKLNNVNYIDATLSGRPYAKPHPLVQYYFFIHNLTVPDDVRLHRLPENIREQVVAIPQKQIRLVMSDTPDEVLKVSSVLVPLEFVDTPKGAMFMGYYQPLSVLFVSIVTPGFEEIFRDHMKYLLREL